MPRYRLTISYDGTDFVGWQRQAAPAKGEGCHEGPESSRERRAETPHAHGTHDGALQSEDDVVAHQTAELRSVQGVVERAVREAVRQPVTLVGASRTDSGVHARHQTAAFTMDERFTADGRRIGPPDDRLREAINSRLPADVLVTACARAADDFDPIAGCLCKGYEYSIWESPDRPLWQRGRVWHQRGPLDVPAMDAAARLLEGEHDFAAFAAAGHGRESTVRTVLSCRVERDARERELVVIRVSADGFLWNMVRIISGTLLEVGRGKTAPGEVAGVLASRDRGRAGPTAPAHGLCLAWGLYEGDAMPDGVSIDEPWLRARMERVRARRRAWAEARVGFGGEGGTRGAGDAAGESA